MPLLGVEVALVWPLLVPSKIPLVVHLVVAWIETLWRTPILRVLLSLDVDIDVHIALTHFCS